MAKKYKFKKRRGISRKIEEKIARIPAFELPKPRRWRLVTGVVLAAVIFLFIYPILSPQENPPILLVPSSIQQFSEIEGSQVAGCNENAFTDTADPFWQKYPHACFAQVAGGEPYYDPARNLAIGSGLHGLFLQFNRRPSKIQLVTGTANCGAPQVTDIYLFDFQSHTLSKAMTAETEGCGPKSFVINLPSQTIKDNKIGFVLACAGGKSCFWRNILAYS